MKYITPNRTFLIVSLISTVLLLLISCGPGSEKSADDPLASFTGTWTSMSNEVEAELVIRSDQTFHVHLEPVGIDAEGTVSVEGMQITFLNKEGTDETAADPAPGVYNYMMSGNRVTFYKVEDTLERRARILSGAFEKTE